VIGSLGIHAIFVLIPVAPAKKAVFNSSMATPLGIVYKYNQHKRDTGMGF
jgi:hypothetical protein